MIKNLQIYTFSRKNHRTGNPLLFVNFAYLNFDDSALLDGFEESKVEDLLDEVYNSYKFLLLDEVQNLSAGNKGDRHKD